MMFCVQCGKEISDAAKFCPHCGAMIAVSAPDQGFTPDQGSAPNQGFTPNQGFVPDQGFTPNQGFAPNPAPAPDQGYVPNQAPTPGDGAGAGPYTYAYGSAPSYSAGTGGYTPPTPPAPPQDTEKRGKKGLFIGGAVAAVAVVAAVLFMVFSGVFSSPKGRVEAAFAKTMSAFSKAREGMDLPDLSELTQSKSVSQSFSLRLKSINSMVTGGYDLSSLEGLGLRMSTDYDQNRRTLGAELAAFWGDNEIASFLMAANDNILSFASPQFTGGDAYGLDTETLGADLARLGLEDDDIDVRKIGFNLFELAEELSAEQQPEELEQKSKDAAKKLADAVKVEKAGKKTIDVNGNSVDAAAYLVTVPEEAMEAYIDALSDAMALVDSQEQSRKLLRGIGLDEETIGYMLPDMSGMDPYGEMFDALKPALRELGDLELEVYLNDGYVCAVEYAIEKNGSRLELGLYLGGGDNYVDNFSLRLAVDGDELVLESAGNHGGKDGVVTDETTFRMRSGGSTQFRISSNFSYEPKATADNFEWSLNVNNMASVKMSGQLTAGKDSLDLRLDDVSLSTAGIEICSLAADYHVGPYAFPPSAAMLDDPTLLGSMDEDDLMDLYYDIEYYAMEWQYDMLALIPEDLFWAFY